MPSSSEPRTDGWWYCEPLNTLVKGPGFDFDALVATEGDKIIIRHGKALDSPVEIPLDLLRKYLQEKGQE